MYCTECTKEIFIIIFANNVHLQPRPIRHAQFERVLVTIFALNSKYLQIPHAKIGHEHRHDLHA